MLVLDFVVGVVPFCEVDEGPGADSKGEGEDFEEGQHHQNYNAIVYNYPTEE